MKRFVILMATLLLATGAFAQQKSVVTIPTDNLNKYTVAPTNAPHPTTYGTGTTSVNVDALAHQPFITSLFGSPIMFYFQQNGRFDSLGELGYEASFQIPNGAIITGAEVYACDRNSSTGVLAIPFVLTSDSTNNQWGLNVLNFMYTGDAFNGGCSFFYAPLNYQVDNYTQSIHMEIVPLANDGSVGFVASRFYYKLQVSPAPAVASFTDVPTTHPFFQYIEALKASGITSGCSATQFCPDAPVTRSQMAKFLAVALGLNFPN